MPSGVSHARAWTTRSVELVLLPMPPFLSLPPLISLCRVVGSTAVVGIVAVLGAPTETRTSTLPGPSGQSYHRALSAQEGWADAWSPKCALCAITATRHSPVRHCSRKDSSIGPARSPSVDASPARQKLDLSTTTASLEGRVCNVLSSGGLT